MSKLPKLRFKEFDDIWSFNTLNNLTTVLRCGIAATPEYVDEGIVFLSSQNVTSGGKLSLHKYSRITKEYYEKISKNSKLLQGDILYTRVGAGFGTATIFPYNGDYGVYVSLTHIRANELLDNTFLKYLLNSPSGKEQARNGVFQGGGVPNLNVKIVEKFKIYYPSKIEQKKIASFFSAVDIKVDQLTRKKELLEQYKKGVMQKIFSQELRCKDDDGSEFPEWEEKKLGSFIKEYKKKSITNDEYPVFTSSHKGLMMQSDYFGENRIVERENIGFNIIPEGYITYRSRSDNRVFTFNINDLGMTGVISTYYPVFEFQNGDNHFFVEYANFHRHIFGKYSVGTSQTVLSLTEVKNIKMKLPVKQEQTKIVNFLSAIDAKIDLVTQQLDQAKNFSKGLLQQMFV